MHRSDAREFATCADCGAEIAPGRERAYSFGEESALCWACAVRHGGTYDEELDRWVELPTAGDLSGGEA